MIFFLPSGRGSFFGSLLIFILFIIFLSSLRRHISGKNPEQNTFREDFFFEGLFSLLAFLVKADGKVSQEEKDKIEVFMAADLHLSEEQKKTARTYFNKALNDSNANYEKTADAFFRTFYSTPQILALTMDILFRVAMSDGTMSSKEEQFIYTVGRIFRCTATFMQNLRNRYANASSSAYGTGASVSSAYKILGISENADISEIKKAYRKLALKFHPDATASENMSKEMKDYSSKKFQEVQNAYETICKERGIK